jgi:hypothetical protein
LAFIDEAGDPGLNTVRPIDPNGGTEWLCLAAVVIRAKQDADLAGWIQLIQEFAKLLKPIIAKEYGHYINYGLALQPTPPSKAQLNSQQKEIFDFYGYVFWP